MSLHSGQASREHWPLEPKHRVFLSHSGAQKGFVEQLCKDLEGWDRYPFFDKRRDCLPIGEPFPRHIFEAIRQCQVGVVILSEEFFTSKWPMLELAEMAQILKKNHNQMKIMPIFLTVSCADLGDDKKLCEWKSKWQKWAECGERINLTEWEGALKSLKPINGLVFNLGVGEVKLREEIVKEICKIVPPFHRWDDSHVQGRSRLSEAICDKIGKTQVSGSYGVGVVGLYGVGGIGKTTACKSLCQDFFREFGGRVCHIEFGNDTSEKDRLDEVLKQLTDTNKECLKDLNLDKCWSRLRGIMRLNMVFLAIDNVSHKWIDEAKKYLQAGYLSGSIVMVTARALGVLNDLKIDGSRCLEMPELVEDEAKALFLYHAERKNEVDEEVLMHCIKRCCFSKGFNSSLHYHPLALKVLGSQLAANDPEEWEKQIKEVDVFNQGRVQDDPVFSILRRSFDELMDEDKLLFMDVALFDVGGGYEEYRFHSDIKFWSWHIFEWLSMVHGLSMEMLRKRLNGLKKKSLLEELGDGTTQIGMHDLWREFGVMESKCGVIKGRLWVYELVDGEAQDSCLSSGGWKKLQRISITGDLTRSSRSVKYLDFSNCSKVTVLKLVAVVVENKALDLSALKHLKSLEIASFKDLPGCYLVSGIGLLTDLRFLTWLEISVESASRIEEISCLTKLEVLKLTCRFVDVSTKLELGQLRWLREVRVKLKGEVTISGLNSKMTNLRVLDLQGCSMLRDCPGVGDIVGLEVLNVRKCCRLEELPNLQKLVKLRVLDIYDCGSLKAVAGLGSLVALEELNAWNCGNLVELPDMSNLTSLQVVNLLACNSFKYIPGLGNLVALRKFCGSGQLLQDWPDLGKLTKLHTASIRGWDVEQSPESASWEDGGFNRQEPRVFNLAILESVLDLSLLYGHHELTNLGKLTSLQQLYINEWRCKALSGLSDLTALRSLDQLGCGLRRLPDMGKHMRLESLRIRNCESLEGWDGVGRWSESQTGVDLHCDWTLPHLYSLRWVNSAVVELPDLSYFPRLRVLDISHSSTGRGTSSPDFALHCLANHLQLVKLSFRKSPIKELPDLSKFPCLKVLCVDDCHNLTSLSSSGPLTALKYLWLERCQTLEALPGFDLLPRLRDFSVAGCGVKFNVHCLANHLQLIEILRFTCLPILELPDLSKFPCLKELRLKTCRNLTILSSTAPLTALKVLHLEGCSSLKSLPDISLFPRLRDFKLEGCNMELGVQEAENLRARCPVFM